MLIEAGAKKKKTNDGKTVVTQDDEDDVKSSIIPNTEVYGGLPRTRAFFESRVPFEGGNYIENEDLFFMLFSTFGDPIRASVYGTLLARENVSVIPPRRSKGEDDEEDVSGRGPDVIVDQLINSWYFILRSLNPDCRWVADQETFAKFVATRIPLLGCNYLVTQKTKEIRIVDSGEEALDEDYFQREEKEVLSDDSDDEEEGGNKRKREDMGSIFDEIAKIFGEVETGVEYKTIEVDDGLELVVEPLKRMYPMGMNFAEEIQKKQAELVALEAELRVEENVIENIDIVIIDELKEEIKKAQAGSQELADLEAELERLTEVFERRAGLIADFEDLKKEINELEASGASEEELTVKEVDLQTLALERSKLETDFPRFNKAVEKRVRLAKQQTRLVNRLADLNNPELFESQENTREIADFVARLMPGATAASLWAEFALDRLGDGETVVQSEIQLASKKILGDLVDNAVEVFTDYVASPFKEYAKDVWIEEEAEVLGRLKEIEEVLGQDEESQSLLRQERDALEARSSTFNYPVYAVVTEDGSLADTSIGTVRKAMKQAFNGIKKKDSLDDVYKTYRTIKAQKSVAVDNITRALVDYFEEQNAKVTARAQVDAKYALKEVTRTRNKETVVDQDNLVKQRLSKANATLKEVKAVQDRQKDSALLWELLGQYFEEKPPNAVVYSDDLREYTGLQTEIDYQPDFYEDTSTGMIYVVPRGTTVADNELKLGLSVFRPVVKVEGEGSWVYAKQKLVFGSREVIATVAVVDSEIVEPEQISFGEAKSDISYKIEVIENHNAMLSSPDKFASKLVRTLMATVVDVLKFYGIKADLTGKDISEFDQETFVETITESLKEQLDKVNLNESGIRDRIIGGEPIFMLREEFDDLLSFLYFDGGIFSRWMHQYATEVFMQLHLLKGNFLGVNTSISPNVTALNEQEFKKGRITTLPFKVKFGKFETILTTTDAR